MRQDLGATGVAILTLELLELPLDDFEDKLVRLEVGETEYDITEATQDEAEEFWAMRPSLPPLPPVDDRYESLDRFEDMDFSDMRTTEFFMSRFSLTVIGAVVPTTSTAPPTSLAGSTTATTSVPSTSAAVSATDTNEAVIGSASSESQDSTDDASDSAEPPAVDAAPSSDREDSSLQYVLMLIAMGLGALMAEVYRRRRRRRLE